MDEVIEFYKESKFEKCIELLNETPDTDDLQLSLMKEHRIKTCQALLAIIINNTEKFEDTQDNLFLFYQKVVSLPDGVIPLELKLVSENNLMWWILHFGSTDGLDESEIEECLEIINEGFLNVLDDPLKKRTFTNTVQEVLHNIKCVEGLLISKCFEVVTLILEKVVIAFLYILKTSKKYMESVCDIICQLIPKFEHTVLCTLSVKDFHPSPDDVLFKLGFSKINEIVNDCDDSVLDYLKVVEAVLQFLARNFKLSMKTVKNATRKKFTCLWNYLAGMNSYMLEDYNSALGFLTKISSSAMINQLKSRCYILHGRLCSMNSDHKESLKYYKKAKTLQPHLPITYYLMGQEYGKIGLGEVMVESFEEALRVLEEINSLSLDDSHCHFENIILSWMHPIEELEMPQTLYALGVAYALSERFQQSTKTYEKLIALNDPIMYNNEILKAKQDNLVQTPDILTVLHEAATVNLLMGNMTRAEQLCADAADIYIPCEESSDTNVTDVHPIKDVTWIRNLINDELGLENVFPDITESEKSFDFFEENVRFLDEDVIGLLILAEIQRIQETDHYKATLSRILSIFSKYLAKIQKKTDLSSQEKCQSTLVKALAAKVCLNIAKIQMDNKSFLEIDRMFKRALTCNQGDKDVLYNYALFLQRFGHNSDTSKLWKTFYDKITTVNVDDCHSLALRHLLNTHVSRRQLEEMRSEIEADHLPDE